MPCGIRLCGRVHPFADIDAIFDADGAASGFVDALPTIAQTGLSPAMRCQVSRGATTIACVGRRAIYPRTILLPRPLVAELDSICGMWLGSCVRGWGVLQVWPLLLGMFSPSNTLAEQDAFRCDMSVAA